MADRFTHDRRAHRLIAATATLIVLVAGGCTDGSDETDNAADTVVGVVVGVDEAWP